MTTCRFRRSNRGRALLTVLWISAALSAIAFSLANTVRGETERVSTDLDALRAYYLATGAVERAAVEKLWTIWNPRRFPPVRLFRRRPRLFKRLRNYWPCPE